MVSAPRIPFPLIACAVILGLLMLNQAWGGASVYSHGSRSAVLLGAAYASVFWLVITTVQEEKALYRLTIALIVTGFLVAFFSILQSQSWNGKIYWIRETLPGQRAHGPFINRNHL
ncbi:MAG TPA: hypothetical protein VIU33_05660, partial [Nitrospiria bacterium]